MFKRSTLLLSLIVVFALVCVDAKALRALTRDLQDEAKGSKEDEGTDGGSSGGGGLLSTLFDLLLSFISPAQLIEFVLGLLGIGGAAEETPAAEGA